MQQRINCKVCKYYFVTWEQGRPHGCQAYGFKSHEIPSVVVKRSSKMDCTMFTPKHNK